MFTTWLAPFNKPNSSWRVKDPLGGASNLEMKDAFLLFHVSFLLMQTRLTHLKNKWFGPSYKLQRHILPVQCYCVVTVVTKVNFSKKVLSVLRSQQHRWHIGFFRDLCQHFHLARHQTCCKTLLSELGLSSVSQNGSAGPFFFFFSPLSWHSACFLYSCQMLCTVNNMAIRRRDSFLWGKGTLLLFLIFNVYY